MSHIKLKAKPDQFRSPNDVEDDNWDNDFASAITPSALQLPHLKPQDHYGGLLSAQNLKSFASFESVTEEAANWDDNFEGELTVKSPLQVTATDALKTVRSSVPADIKADGLKITPPAKSPKKRMVQAKGKQDQTRPAKMVKKSKTIPPTQPQSTLQYQEDPDDDYSDLVLANDGAFEGRLTLNTVSVDPPPLRIFLNVPEGQGTSLTKAAPPSIIYFNSFRHAATCARQPATANSEAKIVNEAN